MRVCLFVVVIHSLSREISTIFLTSLRWIFYFNFTVCGWIRIKVSSAFLRFLVYWKLCLFLRQHLHFSISVHKTVNVYTILDPTIISFSFSSSSELFRKVFGHFILLGIKFIAKQIVALRSIHLNFSRNKVRSTEYRMHSTRLYWLGVDFTILLSLVK